MTYHRATKSWAERYSVTESTIRRWRRQGFSLGDDVKLAAELWDTLRRPPPWAENLPADYVQEGGPSCDEDEEWRLRFLECMRAGLKVGTPEYLRKMRAG